MAEASPYDKIWGIRLSMDDPKIQNPNNWRGESLRGFALMETRDILKEQGLTYKPERVHEWVKAEIEQMYENGVDAVLAEDYFGSSEDVEWALEYLQSQYPEKVYGINMLSDPELGFKLAVKYGAKFLQMDSVCGALRPGSHRSDYNKTWIYDKTCDGDFAECLAELCAQYSVFLLERNLKMQINWRRLLKRINLLQTFGAQMPCGLSRSFTSLGSSTKSR